MMVIRQYVRQAQVREQLTKRIVVLVLNPRTLIFPK